MMARSLAGSMLPIGFKSQRRSTQNTFHSPGLLLLLLLLLVLPGPYLANAAPSASDCSQVQRFYVNKMLPVEHVFRRPEPGNELSVCIIGMTCCSKPMEERLVAKSDEEIRASITKEIHKHLNLLTTKRKALNTFMLKILGDSYATLHKMFAKTYGYIYLSHSSIFKDLYQQMKLYFKGDKENIGKHIDDFFSKLQSLMVLMMEKDARQDKNLRDCLHRELKRSRAFGDVPDNIKSGMRRTLVTSRTFIMVMSHLRDLLERILNRIRVTLSRDCINALTRMNMCPMCAGVQKRPCPKFCNNVMRGCLFQLYDIKPAWDGLIQSMVNLAERMSGPLSIERSMHSLGIKVSDGIMNFQKTFNNASRVRFVQKCRMPRGKRSVPVMPTKGRSRDNFGWSYNKAWALTKLIRQVKDKVMMPLKGLWTSLMSAPCRKAENQCWNGTAVAPYEHALVDSTLAAQVNNQEVAVDLSSKDPSFAKAKELMNQLKKSCELALYNNEVNYIASSPVSTTFPQRSRLPIEEGSGVPSNGPIRQSRPLDTDTETSGMAVKPLLKSTNGPTPVSRPDLSRPAGIPKLPPDDDDRANSRLRPGPGFGAPVEGSGQSQQPTSPTGQAQRSGTSSTARAPWSPGPTRETAPNRYGEVGRPKTARQPAPTAIRPSQPSGERTVDSRRLPENRYVGGMEGSGGWQGPQSRWKDGRMDRPSPGPGPDDAVDRTDVEGSGGWQQPVRRLPQERSEGKTNWPNVGDAPYPSEVWVPKDANDRTNDYKVRSEGSGRKQGGKPSGSLTANSPNWLLVLLLACTVVLGLQPRNDG